MSDPDKAFSVDNGVYVDEDSGGPFYTGGSASPVGLDRPTDTFYLQTTASGVLIWRKFGAGTNDWRQLSAQDIPSPNVTSGTPPGSDVEARLNALLAQYVPFDVSALTTNSTDLVGLTQTQQVVSALANRHFGKRFQSDFTAAALTTSSTSFVDIASLTTGSLPSGTYLVIGYAAYLKTLLAGQIETRIFLNGTTEYSLGQVSMDDDDFYFQNTLVALLSGISGVNTVALQMRKASGGGNIEAINRTLTLWRVA